jgi:hypothetical protein
MCATAQGGEVSPAISFGDRVRVRVTPHSERAGVAGLLGQVYGETTPSATAVEVVGELLSDFAVNVYFEERGSALWFAPEELEFVDHAAGTEITLEGVAKRWVRGADGEWIEARTNPPAAPRKRWWKPW